jgi:hypothetical protein
MQAIAHFMKQRIQKCVVQQIKVPAKKNREVQFPLPILNLQEREVLFFKGYKYVVK